MRETPKASAAFHEYCLLGPSRSLRKLADRLHQFTPKSPPGIDTLKMWSSEHNWQERVKEFDKEQAEERLRKQQQEIEKMNQEHALLGRTQALRAVKQIEELIKVQKFGSQAAVQLLKVATDLERLARGAATDRQEITGSGGAPFQTIFYLPKVDEESEEEQKGGDANNANDNNSEDSKD